MPFLKKKKCIISGCSCTTVTELNSCNRDCKAYTTWNIYCLASYRSFLVFACRMFLSPKIFLYAFFAVMPTPSHYRLAFCHSVFGFFIIWYQRNHIEYSFLVWFLLFLLGVFVVCCLLLASFSFLEFLKNTASFFFCFECCS